MVVSLSIKEGVKPVEDEGAQGEADQHGGEDVKDGVAVHGLAPDEVMDKDLQDVNSFEFVKVAVTVIPSNGRTQFFGRRLINCPSLIGYAVEQADQLAFFKVIRNMVHTVLLWVVDVSIVKDSFTLARVVCNT
jgi:hypothetical protein